MSTFVFYFSFRNVCYLNKNITMLKYCLQKGRNVTLCDSIVFCIVYLLFNFTEIGFVFILNNNNNHLLQFLYNVNWLLIWPRLTSFQLYRYSCNSLSNNIKFIEKYYIFTLVKYNTSKAKHSYSTTMTNILKRTAYIYVINKK